MPAAHIVKTSVYEGPLDLLLELIEKRKLLINDISLAEVTDEYISRLNAMPELPVGETADFVSLAATLLLIKSRSLLPTLTLSDDESRDIKELEYRLAVYQLIKRAALELDQAQKGPTLCEAEPFYPEPLFIFDSILSRESLRTGVQALIDNFPKTLTLPKVEVKKIISIEEVIEKLAQRVSTAFQLSFKQFSGHGKGAVTPEIKHSIIISFLALLELVKQGIIRANQHDHFSDITLESDSVSTPTYE